MLSVEDLEAVLEDLEDICARLPKRFNFEYKINVPTPDLRGFAVYYSCIDHKYYLATMEKGRAMRTREVTREQILGRYERALRPYVEGAEPEEDTSLYSFED